MKFIESLSDSTWAFIEKEGFWKTHQCGIRETVEALGWPCGFDTSSTGHNPQDQNCYFHPYKSGFRVKDYAGNSWVVSPKASDIEDEHFFASQFCAAHSEEVAFINGIGWHVKNGSVFEPNEAEVYRRVIEMNKMGSTWQAAS